MNAVVLAVLVMLALSLLRVNVVIALTISAIIGGLTAGLDLATTLSAFSDGLGGNANVALSYAFLGAFAVAISKSGITDLLAQKVIKAMGAQNTHSRQSGVKVVLISAIAAMAVMSQNAVPVHIAFIPILIPPLLHVFAQMQLDRRLIACVLCFGLVTTYMVLPLGFGGIYLHDILLKQLVDHGLTGASAADVPKAMLLPGLGMVAGLLIAIFISYRKPRLYQLDKILEVEPEAAQVNTTHIIVALVAIVAALGAQLYTGSMIVGGLLGFVIFVAGGVIRYQDTQDAFTKGVHMMAMIGFIMITAAGFAAVMKATGQIETLVTTSADWIGNSKGLAAFMMLLVGLLITMGIGSSFSTVPIIAAIFVPLALHLGFSPLAIIALVGTAGALGDAGSPSSDSTLGPTSGLNVDGQHDHIWDTVVPTFLHYNLPLMLMGWVAAMVL